MKLVVTAVALVLLTGAAEAQAPRRFFVEGLAGGVVPTFDIADVAKTGGGFGVAFGYQVQPRWILMAELDMGMHKDKATGSVDIDTRHYIAKVGYSLTGARERGWDIAVNLGAGAVTFDVAGASQSFTYPAINAGAKLAYGVSPQVAFVLSPQGDIAFSEESEVGTTNAWVWPVTAGLRVRF